MFEKKAQKIFGLGKEEGAKSEKDFWVKLRGAVFSAGVQNIVFLLSK